MDLRSAKSPTERTFEKFVRLTRQQMGNLEEFFAHVPVKKNAKSHIHGNIVIFFNVGNKNTQYM